MSDIIFNQIAGGLITLNDSLRAAFQPNGVRCFLIKDGRGSGEGKRWTIVKELTGGWLIEFSEYRGQFKLLYATLDAGFNDEIAQSSYLAYGVPNNSGDIDVFFRDPERCDTIPPTGANAQWKVYYERSPEARFIVTGQRD